MVFNDKAKIIGRSSQGGSKKQGLPSSIGRSGALSRRMSFRSNLAINTVPVPDYPDYPVDPGTECFYQLRTVATDFVDGVETIGNGGVGDMTIRADLIITKTGGNCSTDTEVRIPKTSKFTGGDFGYYEGAFIDHSNNGFYLLDLTDETVDSSNVTISNNFATSWVIDGSNNKQLYYDQGPIQLSFDFSANLMTTHPLLMHDACDNLINFTDNTDTDDTTTQRTFTLDPLGSPYNYYCGAHGVMNGDIIVKDNSANIVAKGLFTKLDDTDPFSDMKVDFKSIEDFGVVNDGTPTYKFDGTKIFKIVEKTGLSSDHFDGGIPAVYTSVKFTLPPPA